MCIRDRAQAVKLLKDDFVGGQGSRGYGHVDIKIDSEKTMLKVIDGNDYSQKPWNHWETCDLSFFETALKEIT